MASSSDSRPTVKEFLRSKAAERALGSGHTKPLDYIEDDNGRVALGFRGHYTEPEIACLFEDLKAMQRACDAWRGVKRNQWGEVVSAPELDAQCPGCRAQAAARTVTP